MGSVGQCPCAQVLWVVWGGGGLPLSCTGILEVRVLQGIIGRDPPVGAEGQQLLGEGGREGGVTWGVETRPAHKAGLEAGWGFRATKG